MLDEDMLTLPPAELENVTECTESGISKSYSPCYLRAWSARW